jgi:hypothetical protein
MLHRFRPPQSATKSRLSKVVSSPASGPDLVERAKFTGLDALLYPQGESLPIFKRGKGKGSPVLDAPHPRLGDTGVQIPNLKFCIDWLEPTLRLHDVRKVMSCASENEMVSHARMVLAVSMRVPEGAFELIPGLSRQGYQRVWLGPGGAQIWASHWQRPGEVHIQLSGNSLELAGTAGQLSMLRAFTRLMASYSRIDFAIDDYAKRITPGEVFQEYKAGYVVSHFREVLPMQPEDMKTGQLRGDSVRFGSRQSKQHLLVYNKFLESKGEIDAIRWEGRMRDEAAAMFAAQVLAVHPDDESGISAVFLGRLRQMVEFREKDGDRADRRSLRPWWAEFVAGAAKLQAYMPSLLKALIEVFQSFGDQYAMFLAIVARVSGGSLEPLYGLIHAGEAKLKTKLSAKHRRYLESGLVELRYAPKGVSDLVGIGV